MEPRPVGQTPSFPLMLRPSKHERADKAPVSVGQRLDMAFSSAVVFLQRDMDDFERSEERTSQQGAPHLN
jgi:hypothetical protein